MLLNLDKPGGFDVTPWADRVRLIDAQYVGAWELPAIGPVSAPTAALIRPDGYVAWVHPPAPAHVRSREGDQAQPGLAGALTTWFGPPAA